MEEQISEVEIDNLQPNPLQPRGVITPESLVELVDSIRIHGILEPLVVASTPAGYQIIAGERRWRAAKLAGFTKVPVVVRPTSAQGMVEMALVENVQREDLNPLERAQAFLRLNQEFNLSDEEIARRIGKSSSYINNSVRLLRLPDAVKDGLISRVTTEGHARSILGLKDHNLMIEAYRILLKKSLSVRATEELVRRMIKEVETPSPHWHGPYIRLNIEELSEAARILEDKIKTLGVESKVEIAQSSRRARIRIDLKASEPETTKIIRRIRTTLESAF